MSMRMSFCIKAATTLRDHDLTTLTDSIEHYVRAGMSSEMAERAAVDDLAAQIKGERSEMVDLVKQQHADLFKSDRMMPKVPAAGRAVQPIRGSDALGQISERLGGMSPLLLPDLSQKVVRTRTSKTGKQTQYTVWDNPPQPGVGPLFRKGGTADMSEVARVLEEQGYIEFGLGESDPGAARQQAETIVKAELSHGGATLQQGNAGAIDAAMRDRIAEEEPWDSFLFTPDDLHAAGYDELDPAVQEATRQLVQEADGLGLDTEALKDQSARSTQDLTEHDYHAHLQAAVQAAVVESRRAAVQAEPGAAQQRGANGVETASEARSPGSDERPGGPDAAGPADRPGLTLEAQTPESLRAKAAQETAGTQAERDAQAAIDRKAAGDAQRGDFTLTGSDRAADAHSGQGDLNLSQSADLEATQVLPRPEVIERGPVPQQDTDAVAKLTAAFKQVESLKALKLEALPRLLKPSDDAPAIAKERYAAADLSEKLFGKRVVYFSSNIMFANGVQADYLPHMVFINEATSRPVMAVLGHELLHSLRQAHPELYTKLGDRLRSVLESPGRYGELLNAKRKSRGFEPLSFDKLREELVADIVGDNFTDPQFWREMSAGQPTLFGRVLRVVRDFFDGILAKLRRERPYGTAQYLNDVQGARDAVVEAMRTFANSPKTASDAVTRVAENATDANASEHNEPFYSELAKQVQTAKMGAAPAQGWLDWLKGLTGKGTIKADEIAWTGLDDWLKMQPGKVTRDQVVSYLAQNGVKVTETTLGEVVGHDLPRGWTVQENPDEDGMWEVRDAQGIMVGDGDSREAAIESAQDHDEPRSTSETKYSQYTLPGGTNYREVLLTLPTKAQDKQEMTNWRAERFGESTGADYEGWNVKADLPDGKVFRSEIGVDTAATAAQAIAQAQAVANNHQMTDAGPSTNYRSNHWDQPNVLAHIRLNDRTDADGKRVLFVEEIQSDWAQEGKKKGFASPRWTEVEQARVRELEKPRPYPGLNEAERAEYAALTAKQEVRGTPSAPFVGKTDAWVSLAIKRVAKMAVDEGYDRVAFVNGEQSAERYDLSKQIGNIKASKTLQGAYHIAAEDLNGRRVIDDVYDAAKLPDVVGKELAQRIVDDTSKDQSASELPDGFNVSMDRHSDPERPFTVIPPGQAHGQPYAGRHATETEAKAAALSQFNREQDNSTTYKGLDLKVGGEGMKAFYDQIVPKVAKEVVRKLGGEGMVPVTLGVPETSSTMSVTRATISGREEWRVWGANDRVLATFPTEAEARADAGHRLGSATPTSQPGFVITDKMREAAAGGLPMFSLPDFTPEERAALKKAGINTDTRWQRMGDRARAAYNTAQAALQSNWARQFQQGALDQFTGINEAIKRDVGGLPVDQDPYVAARLANGGASSVMRGLMLHGQARWAANGQHLEKIPGTEGLLDILAPLGKDLNGFFGWMIGNRAARLHAEGRENNFTPADIAALQGLNKGKEAEFRKAALAYAAFKRSVLDIGEKAGLIDAEGRKVWDQADYIPFYRQMEDRGMLSATGKKGLSGQTSGIRQLKGGEAALNDPMENIVMNFSKLIDASLKNSALAKTVDTLTAAKSDAIEKVGYDMTKQLVPADQVRKVLQAAGTPDQVLDIIPPDAFDGMAKMWAIQAPVDKDVVRIMVGGKPQFYKVHDPLLLKAATSFVPFDFPGLGVMRAFKRVLTRTVTMTPEFMARNFIRDSVASAMISRDGFNPAKSLTGIVKSYSEKGGYEDMLFAGASFQSGNINAADPTSTATAMRRALRKKGMSAASANAFMSSILDTPAKFWEKYRHVGEAIENANREAVFEATQRKTGSTTAAAYEAKDLMDFTLRGSSPVYQLLADVLPFFNARVQGLYRLGRADPKKVAAYGMLMAAAAIALAMANHGNPDYDELPDWDKDTYWHVWIGGKHFRIPKPFELGVAFATIPERIYQYMVGDITGKKLAERLWANVRDQLAFDPVPQSIRPLLNSWANKDTFRDSPIEGMADEGKLPSQRYSKMTSATAVAAVKAVAPAADFIGLSPKKLEYLIGGYLGTAGQYALGLSDIVVRKLNNEPPQPALRLDQIPFVRAFYREAPAFSTVYETDLYKMRTEVDQVFKSVNALKKDDKPDEAAALQDKNEDLLSVRKVIERTAHRLAALNKRRDAIYADREMTPAEKRTAIDEILRQKAEIAKETMKEEEVLKAQ